MKKIAVLIFALGSAWHCFAQLPIQSTNAKVTPHRQITLTAFPVIRNEKIPTTLLATQYQINNSRGFSCIAEVSTIERMNTSGVAIVSRGEHVSTFMAATKRFHLNRRINQIEISGSSLLIWSEGSLYKDTDHYTVEGKISLDKGASISVGFQNRVDAVRESFSIGRLEVPVGINEYRLVSVNVQGRSGRALTPYVELLTGTHYVQSNRLSIRFGEQYRLSHRFSGIVDVEFNQVRHEQHEVGILFRLKADYKITKKITTGIFVINNTFSAFNGLLYYLQVKQQHHVLRMEYREVRNQFRFTESSHPFFASNLLFQYSYRLAN